LADLSPKADLSAGNHRWRDRHARHRRGKRQTNGKIGSWLDHLDPTDCVCVDIELLNADASASLQHSEE